jgi:hypothetical protein
MGDSALEFLRAAEGEKREWRRFNIELTILVEPVDDEETAELNVEQKQAKSRQCTAVVSDISVNGLYFLASTQYPLEALLDIYLTLGVQKFILRGLVTRTETKDLPGRTAYGCGVQFVRTQSVKLAIPAIANYILKKTAANPAIQIVA